jgi:hypothetical protein
MLVLRLLRLDGLVFALRRRQVLSVLFGNVRPARLACRVCSTFVFFFFGTCHFLFICSYRIWIFTHSIYFLED